MSGRKAAGLVLIVAGIVAIAMHGNFGSMAIAGGALSVVIGLMLAGQKEITDTPASPRMPPSPSLLASVRSQSPMVAANFANDELLSVVIGHIQTGHKITAIKSIREQTRCGLKEGKDLVDEVDRVMKKAASGA